MTGTRELDVLVRERLDDVRFRVVDPDKRSRLQGSDLIKLMRIVTRRKTYATPHGKGEEEWQAVADLLNEAVTASFSLRACRDKVTVLLREHKRASAASRRASGIAERHTDLSDLIEAYLQLKTRFDEQQQETKAKKTRKAKRLAAAGNKAMRKAALRVKRRKTGAGNREPSQPSYARSDDSEVDQDEEASGNASRDDHTELRRLLGSDYESEEEETKQEESDESVDTDEEQVGAETHKVGRTRLRVSEIWAKEEEMMAKEREAQAARDNALVDVVKTLANQTKMLLEHLANGSANRSNLD
ncbi:hypothetical protein PR001_g26539 [Phytophthora rubi]|uniref:Uncharacterized protein n=1 Tax=Phytophthora rubi TaxID=129364 RepID=A0A6A3HQ19_9STRA|nr:hypothetical protein PR001_g26539 [Phytophthora rubi]KAE9014590.1 hypothetical protein PR002_g14186 [Phytophthora rubi]